MGGNNFSVLIKTNPNKMTVEAIAKAIGLGHRNSLAHYMRDPSKMRVSVAVDIARACGYRPYEVINSIIKDVRR